jgi:hypothetical protein
MNFGWQSFFCIITFVINSVKTTLKGCKYQFSVKFSAAQPLSRSAAQPLSRSDSTVVAGDFTAYGVKGTVSGQNITLDLSGLGNCATNIENMVIGVNANTYPNANCNRFGHDQRRNPRHVHPRQHLHQNC